MYVLHRHISQRHNLYAYASEKLSYLFLRVKCVYHFPKLALQVTIGLLIINIVFINHHNLLCNFRYYNFMRLIFGCPNHTIILQLEVCKCLCNQINWPARSTKLSGIVTYKVSLQITVTNKQCNIIS
jgi:hypothetical protein